MTDVVYLLIHIHLLHLFLRIIIIIFWDVLPKSMAPTLDVPVHTFMSSLRAIGNPRVMSEVHVCVYPQISRSPVRAHDENSYAFPEFPQQLTLPHLLEKAA